jgi:transposase-like protein
MTGSETGGPAYRDDCVEKRRRVRARGGLPADVERRLDELFPRETLVEALRGLRGDQITAPGGLITALAGRVVEAALQAEMTAHLGYEPGSAPEAANIRNGSTSKTLHTDHGSVEIRTPRDRDGTFDPQLVRKRQTRLAGLDDRILDLYAGGMSTRDIADHLSGLYGVDVGRDTISKVTGAVLADAAAWRTRPLERVYPVVYFDAMRVKMRKDRSVQSRACYQAIGVTCDGEREPLGIWWQDEEGARFWLAVLNDLSERGVSDIMICCVDGLNGFPDAIEAVYPDAWVQTCIVHLIRNSMRYVSYKDRKQIARDLRPIYTAVNAESAISELDRFDEKWGAQYPVIARMWRKDWDNITPFLSLPAPLRRVVYTTNTIESMHRQTRKAIKTRGAFPDQDSATKLIYLAVTRSQGKWRKANNWTAALAALKIHFPDRIPD